MRLRICTCCWFVQVSVASCSDEELQSSRKLLAEAYAQQWFGAFLGARSPDELWLVNGLARCAFLHRRDEEVSILQLLAIGVYLRVVWKERTRVACQSMHDVRVRLGGATWRYLPTHALHGHNPDTEMCILLLGFLF